MAKEHGLEFMETSAKTNVNIDVAFIKLGEAILEKKRNQGLIDREIEMGDFQHLGRIDGDGHGGKSLCRTCS